MHRKLLATTAALAVLGLAACNRDAETEPAAEATPAAESSTPAGGAMTEADMPAATTAQGFAMRAALSDMFEIQSSRLALEKSQSDAVKTYAQRMVTDHQSMTNQLQAALGQAGVTMTPPTELDRMKADMLQQLRDASPTDFDDRYIDGQTEAHENALNLLRDYAGNGDNPTLQAFARNGAPMVENHLQTVRALDKSAADDKPGAAADSTPTANRN